MKQLFDRVAEAKNNRNGGPRKDRPDSVESLLNNSYTVGFKEGEPVASVVYEQYPNDRATILRPQSGKILNDIAESVESMEQLADELGIDDGQLLNTATELHGIDLPDSVEPNPLEDVPDGEGDTIKINTNQMDFPAYFHLYATLGMGMGEISQVVSTDEREVRRDLGDYNLL